VASSPDCSLKRRKLYRIRGKFTVRILVCDAECVIGNSRYPLKDAFENLGHRVDVFDWSYYFPRHTDSRLAGRVTSRLFERSYINTINKHLCAMVGKVQYDLVLVMMGKYFFPETIQHLKEHAACVVNWSSDDIFNLKSSSEYAKSSIQLYDAYFTPRPHLLAEFAQLGAKNVFPLEWYYRPGMLDSESRELPEEYRYPISFVGSWSSRREEFLSPLLGDGAHIFGWGWPKKTSKHVRKYSGQLHPQVSIESMHDIIRNSAINVNILTIENRDVTALRYFEIPSVKGFQLAERSDAVLKNFEEDKEIVCFAGRDELISKCKFYLGNDSARRKIALAGYNRLVRSDYSLEARLDTVLSHVKNVTR
jgi:spore maturation protein CgeB